MPTPAIRLFSTDLDGTLLGNPVACWRFAETWNLLPAARRPRLVYNASRSVAATLALVRTQELPQPDFIIGGIGTELHDAGGRLGEEFQRRFGAAWTRERVDPIVRAVARAAQLSPAAPSEFKSSWIWVRAPRDELAALPDRLAEAGIPSLVNYSCRYFLDVVPANAGKGNGLAWLCERLGVPLETVLVAGDTGHDASMFLLPGVRGILVENALPELRAAVLRLPVFTAGAETADGVLEGLQHFELLSGTGR